MSLPFEIIYVFEVGLFRMKIFYIVQRFRHERTPTTFRGDDFMAWKHLFR